MIKRKIIFENIKKKIDEYKYNKKLQGNNY